MMNTQLLNSLLAINTSKDKENEKIRILLKTYLKKYNFEFQEIGKGSTKVLVCKRKKAPIAFICHTDTVEESIYWTKKPFQLTKEQDKLYGLGIADMKGGISALLEAISKVDKELPCMICFTYDEETNFTGINQLVASDIELPKFLVFTEPTNLTPVIANKGCIEFKVTFQGKSAHSSTPQLGDNALYKAIDFVTSLKKIARTLSKDQVKLYEVPYTTFNLSKIAGGNEINKVPDTCEITFDFRTIKKEHNNIIIKKIKELTASKQVEAIVLNNLNAVVTENKQTITALELLTAKKCIGLNYTTEASFYPDKEIVIVGPGPITAHQPDEYITYKSYKQCQQVYQKLMEDFQ